jgi:hypothetical protein
MSHQKAYAFMLAFRGWLWAEEQLYHSTFSVWLLCQAVAQFPPE